MLRQRFNLARMECKPAKAYARAIATAALISPEWNVNMKNSRRKRNVILGFNLARMECKLKCIGCNIICQWCFNLARMECKLFLIHLAAEYVLRFNLARMECKRILITSQERHDFRFNLARMECKHGLPLPVKINT